MGGIICILAVGDRCELPLPGHLIHPGEQLRFAEVTAVHQILRVAGILEFRGGDDLDDRSDPFGHAQGLRQRGAREAGGVGDDTGRILSQRTVSHRQ